MTEDEALLDKKHSCFVFLTAHPGDVMMEMFRNEGELSPEGWPSGLRRLS